MLTLTNNEPIWDVPSPGVILKYSAIQVCHAKAAMRI